MATSIKQDAARLNMTLDSIWRLGDLDEVSIKHVASVTATLAEGLDWTEADEYKTPFGDECDWVELDRWGDRPIPDGAKIVKPSDNAPEWVVIPWTESRRKDEHKRLAERWSKVVAKRDSWGAERFNQVMLMTKFGGWHRSYCELRAIPASAPRLTLVK